MKLTKQRRASQLCRSRQKRGAAQADVIEQARNKVRLRQSEERFRALVTANSYLVYRMSPDWTEMREFDGKGVLSDTKIPTQKWLETYIHPDDQPQVMEVIRNAIRKKSPFMLEHRTRRADGSSGWTLLRAVPLLDAKGRIAEWVGAASDVTQWKQSEAEAQAIIDLAPVAVFIARDPQCLEITGNRMAYEMVRFPPGSNISPSVPVGQRQGTFRVVKNGTEIPASELPMQKAAATGQSTLDFEHDLLYQDGTRRSFIGNAVPLFGEDHEPRGAVGTFLDITALKEAEEKLRVFLTEAPVAVVISDMNGKMAVANTQAQRMFKYSREEMVGQSVEMLMPESLRHKHVRERTTYLQKPRARPMGIGLELSARRKDGSKFPVEITLTPIETSSGTFVSAMIFDLTDRKRLEEQTRLATVLQERNRVARDLHDTLAQAFTAIIINLELAGDAVANLPEETKSRLDKAVEVARENLAGVRHILRELSGPLGNRPKDLAISLRELADRMPSTEKTRVKFSLCGTPQPIEAVVKENLLFIARQATDNALRHGNASTVDIRLSFIGHDVRLQVQDDGRGFDIEKVEHGMGLANMQDRTKFIGGQFTLRSQTGKGTVVEARISLLRPPQKEIA